MKKKLLLVIISFISFILFSQTSIPAGDVSGQWYVSDSPYQIEGNITIPDGETLTIDPGCLIEFQGHYKLDVRGRLLAIGSESDSIRFSVVDTTGFHLHDVIDGSWDGIHFDSLTTVNDSSKIKYAVIEYCKVIGDYFSSYTRGGAIRCRSNYCHLIIENCLFINNYASGYGGAIYSCISDVKIINNTFLYNSSSRGGAISFTSEGEVSNNLFLHNSAGYGGAINLTGSSCLVNGNRISNNSANYGGAISFYNHNDGSIVANNVICNNSAWNGAGCFFFQSTGTLINNTIVNNYDWHAGGLYFEAANGLINIYNSIIYGNECQNGPNQVNIFYGGSNPNFYNCNIEGGIEGFSIYNGATNYTGDYMNNIDYPPMFVDPSDGVGNDFIDYDSNWSLLSSSTSINHGIVDTTGLAIPDSDISGNPRIYQGIEPRIDIGAYEYQGEPDSIPGILVTPQTLDFGIHTIYTSSEVMDLVISNIGFSTLSINNIYAPAGFLIKRENYPQFGSYITPFNIEPYSGEIINVIFEPISPGIFDGDIVINSNDQLFPTSFANVKGIGENWPVYSGNIESNTFWDTDTVKVIDSIIIDNGVILDIAPGTVIEIFEGCSIDVQGTISAIGTIQDSIVFTCDNNYQRWGGIKFDQTPEDNDSSRFAYCSFTRSKSSPGGAMYLREFSKVNLGQCNFKNNIADQINGPGYGGALSLSYSSPQISDCFFSNNYATGEWYHSGHGGGIYIYHSSPVIKNCTIENNLAFGGDYEDNGGGIYCEGSNVRIYFTTISNNTCEDLGAAIYCMQSTLRIESTLINNNDNGGGVVTKFSPNVKILSSTITNNSDNGLSCDRSIDLFNTIIWSNANQVYLSHYTADPNFYNCNIEGGVEAFIGEGVESYSGVYENNIDEDPNFQGIGEHPYQLSEGSPCIDSGTPDTSDMNLLPCDIIGNVRIWDGNNDDTPIIDIGSYEYGAPLVETNNNILKQPHNFMLVNYPNPFNPETVISYHIPYDSDVELNVYNIKGQKVKTLISDKLTVGKHSIIWNGKDSNDNRVGSGIYFYKMKAGDFQRVRKMILLR